MEVSSNPAGQQVQRKGFFAPLMMAAALLLVLLSGFVFAHTAISGLMVATLAGLGLDPPRGQLVTLLLLTLFSCLIAAFLVRQGLVVVLGGIAFFGISYLVPFVRTAFRPVLDPGGLPEPLDALALVRTTLILLALTALCGVIGVALGRGLAHVLLDPFVALFRYLRRNWRAKVATKEAASVISVRVPGQQTTGGWRIASGLLQAVLVVAMLSLAVSSVNLFVYGPDVGLHLSPAQANGRLAQGTMVNDSFVSPAMKGQRRTFVVYLPPSYNLPADREKRYPVLYLLHGSPGQQTNWLTGGKAGQSADTLSQLKKVPEVILVMPDGNGRGGETSEWGNSGDGKQMLENAIVQDLVPYVDLHYRTLASARYRGIGGLSMGGFGAANIGIHHPDVFSVIIALGGYYHSDGSIWGKNIAYQLANSPAYTLPHQKAAWKSAYFIGGATKDELYSESVNFAKELKRLHIPYTFVSQIGYHSWGVWQVEFYQSLIWLDKILPASAEN